MRVGAILQQTEDGVVEFLGYDVLQPDKVIPEDGVGLWTDICKETGDMTPKIVLDSGEVVYGCECWWAAEDEIKQRLAEAKEVKQVSITQVRADYWGEENDKVQ